MKTLATIVAAAGLAAGTAQAQTITYTLTATANLASGSGADGLDGATFSFTADYDASGLYVNNFGLPSVDAFASSITISGSSEGANNTTSGLNNGATFYPTFAGSFDNAGGFIEFNLGNGSLYQFGGNTTPATGAGNAVIGGPIELDDFAVGATYTGFGLFNLSTGDNYTFSNVRIDAVIPAPASLALLGLGGIAAIRRRR